MICAIQIHIKSIHPFIVVCTQTIMFTFVSQTKNVDFYFTFYTYFWPSQPVLSLSLIEFGLEQNSFSQFTALLFSGHSQTKVESFRCLRAIPIRDPCVLPFLYRDFKNYFYDCTNKEMHLHSQVYNLHFDLAVKSEVGQKLYNNDK